MSFAAQAEDPSSVQILLNEGMHNALESAGQIGNAAIVMHKGEIIAKSQNGFRQKDTNNLVDPSDKWHIGSITKSMTATMLGRLDDKGLIDLDAKLGDIATDLEIELDAAWQEVKLIDLLTHTSGAPANFGLGTLLNRDFTDQTALNNARWQSVKDIFAAPPEFVPGTQFQYSNVGYTIAGALAAKITDVSYEELMRTELFNPLGLSSAGFGAPKGDNPWGHGKKFLLFLNAISPDEKDADNTPIMAPAGTVHMTMEDLATFGEMHAALYRGNSDFLSAKTAQKLHTPAPITVDQQPYAAGLAIIDIPSQTPAKALFHNGSNTMWYALLLILPEEQITIAMATNIGTIEKSEKAFFNLAVKIVEALDKE